MINAPEGSQYVDLTIDRDDIKLDAAGVPVYICDSESIGQDIVHAIRESGFLVDMIANRNRDERRILINKIKMLVENDIRIIPGTVEIMLIKHTRDSYIYSLTADTYNDGSISTTINGSSNDQLR